MCKGLNIFKKRQTAAVSEANSSVSVCKRQYIKLIGRDNSGESLIEDACWLRLASEDKHNNLAELDAMLRGINLALQWKVTVLHLKTDSACVHRWVSDALSEKARIHTKASSEMLIRRRLNTIKELVEEYELAVDVELVRSQANRADQLTRVPQRWLDVLQKETEPVCAASMEEQESTRI